MTSRSRFPRAALLVPSLLAAVLVVPLTGAAAQADDAGAPARPNPQGHSDLSGAFGLVTDLLPLGDPLPADPLVPVDPQADAEAALAEVQDILDQAATAPSTTDAAAVDGNDLSLALTELAATQADLPPKLQDDAAQLLARPNPNDPVGGDECDSRYAGQLPCYGSTPERPSTCDTGICVHSVASGKHAATPTYVNQVLDQMKSISARYQAAGYKRPLPDGTVGMTSGGAGNGPDMFDVYLADLGNLGLYGYCTVDPVNRTQRTASGYCVLDNNYSHDEYPARTPLQNLQVTAAHEYFHAIQFAYDFREDRWMMEATATWAEDELFTAINDNRQFLRSGPLGRPAKSLMSAGPDGLGQYGAWIFFRFLSERYPAKSGGMPVIVRDIWNRAIGTTDARTAVNRTLAARGTDLRKQFGWFTAWNRRPAAYYSEGSAYRAAPLWRSYRLTMGRSVSARAGIDKMASRTVRYKSALQRAGRLRVVIDLNSRNSGGFALVTIKKKNKAPVTTKVKINARGDKRAVYPFGRKVQWVEINLANAGNKNRTAKISARVTR